MGSRLRESIENLGPHDHVSLFFRSRKDQVSSLVPFLHVGLSRGERCLLYADRKLADEACAGLRGAGVDVGSAVTRGSLRIAQSVKRSRRAAQFEPDEMIAFFRSTLRETISERYAALRLVVDMSHALGKEPIRENLLAYQGKFHDFLINQQCLSLCMHDLSAFPDHLLPDCLRSHPLIVYDGKLLENFYFVPPMGLMEGGRGETEFERRIRHLVERHDQLSRIRRQAVRLKRFRDTTASLLAHGSVPDLLRGIAEGVVSLGYRMCWVGMAKPDKSVEPVAISGEEEGYLKEITVRWDGSPLAMGPTGTSIRAGKPDVIRDVTRSERFAPWREKALRRGYLSVAAVPFRDGRRIVGAITAYAAEMDAFDREAIEELAAFALQASLVLRIHPPGQGSP